MYAKRICAVVAAVFTLAVAAPAHASSPDTGTLTPADVSHLESFMTEYGVPPETQDDLIEKYAAGELWDSMEEGEVRRVETLEPGV